MERLIRVDFFFLKDCDSYQHQFCRGFQILVFNKFFVTLQSNDYVLGSWAQHMQADSERKWQQKII